MAQAADYSNLVQQLYIAYFGRPADYFGLLNFEAALTAANAPTDLAGLVAAYSTNVAVKSLIDSFGTSSESTTLYSIGSTESFVNAIFENLFNRTAAVSGLSFWVNGITSGAVTRGDAALCILAAASANDMSTVNAKTAIASAFTANLDTATEIVSYSGANAAALARNMLNSVTSTTNLSDFQSTITFTIASISGTVDYQAQFRNNLAASLTSHHLDSSGQAAQDVINYLAGKVTNLASYNQAMSTLDNDVNYVHLASHSPGTYNASTIANYVAGSASTADTTPADHYRRPCRRLGHDRFPDLQ